MRPNTDVFFYLAFLRELIEIGGVDAPAPAPPRAASSWASWAAVRRPCGGWKASLK